MFCRKCGKQIPDNTKFCIFCGAQVQPGPQAGGGRQPTASPGPSPAPSPKKQKNGGRLLLIICGVFAAIVLIAAVVFGVRMVTSKDDPAPRTIEETEEIEEIEADEAEDGSEAEDEAEEIVTEADVEAETEAASEEEQSSEPAASSADTADLQESTEAAAAESAPQEAGYTTYFVVNCEEWISLRSQPSTSAAALDQIPYGAPVSYIGTAENGFYQVIYNGKTGYALASYLSTEKPEPRSYNSQTVFPTACVVNCEEWISLRVSPNTKADRITTIPLGSYVTVLSTGEANGFWKISYNGYEGYALGQYLSIQ